MTDDSRTVKSDRTLFSIIETIKREQGPSVTDIARELGLAKSTVYDHLSTLEQSEYVVKDEQSYYLGLRFLDLGVTARRRHIQSDLITEKVDELATETGERAQFVTNEHGWGVYIYQAFGEKAVKTDSRIGRRFPLHISAAGKAILAFLPEKQVDAIIETRGLREDTDNTITDSDRLLAELETVRDQHHAFNREESTNGLNAVGVPVLADGQRVIGALSVAGPAYRLKGQLLESEVPDYIRGVANELELHIEFS